MRPLWLIAVTLVGCSQQTAHAPEAATSSAVECAIIRIMLANELAELARMEPNSRFVIDPNGQSPFMRELVDGNRVPPIDVITDYFPELELADARALSGFYDHPRDPWRLACDLTDLSLTPADDTMVGNEADQADLTFPRMAVDRPVISADGRYAIAGFSWSFVPHTGYSDDCLFENVDGTWRQLRCAGVMDGIYG